MPDNSPNNIRTGHYLRLERGEWAKAGEAPAKFYPASGRTYVGGLTLEQREELDNLIDTYLEKIGL